MISTSEIRLSVVVESDRVDDAVRAIHSAFGLDSADTEAVVYGDGTMSRQMNVAVVGATGQVGGVMRDPRRAGLPGRLDALLPPPGPPAPRWTGAVRT